MIRELKYVNSLGQSVVFGGESETDANRENGIEWHFGETDIFNISLDYESVGDSITAFSTGIREFALNAFLAKGSIDERNRFVDVVSYDTYTANKGRLYAGDSYMDCWISTVDISRWQYHDYFAVYDLTIVTDTPVWIREEIAVLTQKTSTPIGGLNYPHNYPHNYLKSNSTNTEIVNNFQLPAKCDISFAGPCVSPYVIIGGNRYQVNETAEKGQLIVIRGHGTKDIVIKDSSGVENSVFSSGVREEGAMVFAEIPVGKNMVSWPGTTNIEVRMYEERRTPWWK